MNHTHSTPGMLHVKHTFRKSEKLNKKKQVEALFARGKSFFSTTLRVQYLLIPSTDGSRSKVLFSVPKKRFKKAVDRNLIRRRVSECFRLKKHELYPQIPGEKQLLVAFIYVNATIIGFEQLNREFTRSFEKLVKEISRELNRDATGTEIIPKTPDHPEKPLKT